MVSSIDPNIVRLPEPVSRASDSSAQRVGREIRAFARGCERHIKDPWSIEDVWLIVLMQLAIDKWRRQLYEWRLKRRRRVDDGGGEGNEGGERGPGEIEPFAFDENAFKESLLGWLGGPMKTLQAVWVTLYARDNVVVRMFGFDGGFAGGGVVSRGVGDFDLAVYTLGLGAVAVMCNQRWLPELLRTKAKIAEASLRIVLTRLVAILLSLGRVLLHTGPRTTASAR
jgi:hypothetical protein